MINITSCIRAVSLSALLAMGGALYAADEPKPDNTKTNKMDHADGAMTADQQKMNSSDRELTQKIRKAIMADKKLSTYAHNAKVIARDGMVTLKGPVRSDAEKSTLETLAAEAAGAGKVTNQLTVAPKKTKTN